MRVVRVVNCDRETILGTRIWMADRWWHRLRGLLGRSSLAPSEGLLLTPCRSVHMVGMAFSLDVAFLDLHGIVVATYPGLRPGRRTGWHRAARYALELPAGTLAATGTATGDRLTWERAAADAEAAASQLSATGASL